MALAHSAGRSALRRSLRLGKNQAWPRCSPRHLSLFYGCHGKRPHLSHLNPPILAQLPHRHRGPGLQQGGRRLGASGPHLFPGRTQLGLEHWAPASLLANSWGSPRLPGALSGPCKWAPNSQTTTPCVLARLSISRTRVHPSSESLFRDQERSPLLMGPV